MKKLSPAKLMLGFLGLSTFVSLVGTVSGTLAWYAYSARAALSYSGSSVSSAYQLQIGLASPVRVVNNPSNQLSAKFFSVMTEEEEMYHNEEDGIDYYCYFADIGTGLDYQVLQYYLKTTGYAADCMMPITSGSYNPDDDEEFALYKSPSAVHIQQDIPSEHENYVKLSFVFKAFKTGSASVEYAEAGEKIWLVDSASHPSRKNDGDVYKAVRVFVDRKQDIGNDFIVAPMYEQSGETSVGGILDLTNDKYFDYAYREDLHAMGEIIYGEYTVDGGISSEGYNGPDVLHNPYGLEDDNDPCCFVSKHRRNIRYYNDLSQCTFKTASYLCMDDVRPDRHPITGMMYNRDESKPTHVCVTGDAEHGHIGSVDLYLWLEGWDHHAIDDYQLHKFDYGLTFEINKI